jgi:hypothetical protein
VCTKLQSRLAIKRAEKIVFIMQKYIDKNTLTSTGEDWEVFLCVIATQWAYYMPTGEGRSKV